MIFIGKVCRILITSEYEGRQKMNSYVIYVIVALASGIASAVIARKKGRDATAWFIGGVLFSIFTLLVVIKLRNLRKKKMGGYDDGDEEDSE
jgi:hypothetical protein